MTQSCVGHKNYLSFLWATQRILARNPSLAIFQFDCMKLSGIMVKVIPVILLKESDPTNLSNDVLANSRSCFQLKEITKF